MLNISQYVLKIVMVNVVGFIINVKTVIVDLYVQRNGSSYGS